jgi:hypothetical protein
VCGLLNVDLEVGLFVGVGHDAPRS